MRASSLLKRLEKNGNKFAKGWEKQKIKVPVICTAKYRNKFDAEFDRLTALANRSTPESNDTVDESVGEAIDRVANEYPKQSEPTEVMLSVAAKDFLIDTPEKLKASLKAISQGTYKVIKAALVAKDVAAKNAKNAEKIGKNDSAKTKAAKRKAYSAKVKLQNMELKYFIADTNCGLKIAAALIGGGSKVGKDDNVAKKLQY